MTAASVTLAAICIAITLFSLTVAAVAVRMARKEIAHSRNVVALNRHLTNFHPYAEADDGLDI